MACPPTLMKGETVMAKKPQTVVKELRYMTETWKEGYVPHPWQANEVKRLVEQLPAFRNAAQTKVETTLRAVEALLCWQLHSDLTKYPVSKSAKAFDPEGLIRALALMINLHHGIGVTHESDKEPPDHVETLAEKTAKHAKAAAEKQKEAAKEQEAALAKIKAEQDAKFLAEQVEAADKVIAEKVLKKPKKTWPVNPKTEYVASSLDVSVHGIPAVVGPIEGGEKDE